MNIFRKSTNILDHGRGFLRRSDSELPSFSVMVVRFVSCSPQNRGCRWPNVATDVVTVVLFVATFLDRMMRGTDKKDGLPPQSTASKMGMIAFGLLLTTWDEAGKAREVLLGCTGCWNKEGMLHFHLRSGNNKQSSFLGYFLLTWKGN